MDYTIPCHNSKVHPDGVCRKKLHRNIGNSFHRLSERMDQEAMEEQMAKQKEAFEEQRRNIDLQEKMLGVGMGSHRVIKETRKNPPKVKPFVPGSGSKPNSKDNKDK